MARQWLLLTLDQTERVYFLHWMLGHLLMIGRTFEANHRGTSGPICAQFWITSLPLSLHDHVRRHQSSSKSGFLSQTHNVKNYVALVRVVTQRACHQYESSCQVVVLTCKTERHISHIGYICPTFPRCAFANISLKAAKSSILKQLPMVI